MRANEGFVHICVLVVIAVAVCVTTIFVGNKKEREIAEEVLELIVEKELGLPDGTLDFNTIN